jgi:hypothetical protein
MKIESQILEIAQKLLENKIDLIKASRELEKFQFGFGLENNKQILFFVAFASETDSFPIGDQRKNWDKLTLLEKDKELKKIKDFYRNDAINASQELIKHFSLRENREK